MFLVSGAQLRAARALVRMDQTKLAELAKVSPVTVGKLEGTDGPLNARTATLRAIQSALETAGVEFKPDGSVRLREQPAEVKAS
jgi:transcriptional regulator with XRE-family HTH domain